MKTSDFHYHLPKDLIALYPAEERGQSRLMVLNKNTGAIEHKKFSNITEFLRPGDLLVFNDSKVIPARLYGAKETGGKVEILIERVLNESRATAHVRSAPKTGSLMVLENGTRAKITGRQDDLYLIELKSGDWFSVMDAIGHIPLPPYIDREDAPEDRNRYQTIYARAPGSVAAPTAGLHFTEEILSNLKSKGVKTAFVTLHVGAGTFQGVRTENITDHKMHAEYIDVPEDVIEKTTNARAKGGRVIAVGTTSLRSLETAQGKPFRGESDIFIYPGYDFKQVDGLITNFHLPESTLLMLVCAFAGYRNAMNAYQSGIDEKYKFFSYGDAMIITD
jgi:S-adenosylmethionine:tRNA ribosyltransferase-isomerase